MSKRDNQRELESSIQTNLEGRLDYSSYLDLPRILSAQHQLSDPPHHDELLFIIQHQTSELWFKLIIHELRAAIQHLADDDPGPCMKILARVKLVQSQLFDQWAVLETLTPSEYVEFRNVFGDASGFQSHQYRLVEFLLGNKNAQMLGLFEHVPEARSELASALESPSLYDAFLFFLSRHGHEIPPQCLNRDLTRAHQRTPELVPVFVEIYRDTERFWTEYALCERLIDVEQSFQLWRFRHLKTVERIIGFKQGTGGSSGVSFLKKALDLTFFPELLDVRTEL